MSVNEGVGSEPFTLFLCDPKPAVCDAFRRAFAGFSFVSITDGKDNMG